MDSQGAVLPQASQQAHLRERPPSVTISPLMMMGYPLIPPSLINPLAGDVGVEGVDAAGVVVTLMEPPPLEVGIRRMDFLARSKYPNLGARRVILMMWLTPLGSGPTVSPTIVIIMRILISCPW